MIPAREALASLLLPVLLAVALFWIEETPGPGPLALCTALSLVHAALLAPAIGDGRPAWAFLPLLLALPALLSTSYGRPGLWPLGGSLLLVVLACLAGAAARSRASRPDARYYLPTMILLFAAPYALRYLLVEFGTGDAPDAWLALSPWAAAEGVAAGNGLSAVAVLLMLAWPVWALARRGA